MNQVIINEEYKYNDYQYLYDIVDCTLTKFKINNAYLEITFVDNDYIHKMNREYRGIDRVTDVISFAFEDNDDIKKEIRVLGEIYICIPRMIEQANSYEHSEKRELSFLTVHGLLHLLGYDHMNENDERVMFKLQDEILDKLKIKE